LFILVKVLFKFGLVALHLSQVLFTSARVLFNFGWVCPASPGLCLFWVEPCLMLAWFALHLAKVLFTLARALFNVGLVCLAFSPGFVCFG